MLHRPPIDSLDLLSDFLLNCQMRVAFLKINYIRHEKQQRKKRGKRAQYEWHNDKIEGSRVPAAWCGKLGCGTFSLAMGYASDFRDECFPFFSGSEKRARKQGFAFRR